MQSRLKKEKWVAVFNKVVIRLGLIQKVTFEQTPEGGNGVPAVYIPGRGNNQ